MERGRCWVDRQLPNLPGELQASGRLSLQNTRQTTTEDYHPSLTSDLHRHAHTHRTHLQEVLWDECFKVQALLTYYVSFSVEEEGRREEERRQERKEGKWGRKW